MRDLECDKDFTAVQLGSVIVHEAEIEALRTVVRRVQLRPRRTDERAAARSIPPY